MYNLYLFILMLIIVESTEKILHGSLVYYNVVNRFDTDAVKIMR